MALKKLSQIATAVSPPAPTDSLVGVAASGPTDQLYTISQIQSAVMTPPMFDPGIVYLPGLADGFSYTIPNGVWHVVLNGSAALAMGTITMPANPVNGQIIRFKTMQLNLSGLTVLPNTGQIVNNYPAEMAQFSYFEATYDAPNATWYLEYIEQLFAESNLTWYVNPNTGTNPGWGVGNDANNGLAITSPFLTIQHAVNVALSYNYQGVFDPTIVLGDGNYNNSSGLGLVNITQPLVAANAGVLFIKTSVGATVNIVASAQGQAWFTNAVAVDFSTCTINFFDTGVNPSGNGSFLGGVNCNLVFHYTGGLPTFSPFFFDPGGNITFNGSTITLTGQFWDAFVNMNEGGSTFTMTNCHVNLPPIMNVSLAFIYGLDFKYSQSGTIWTNFGGVVGQNINTFESSVYTGGGDLSAIPGNAVPYWDFSDKLLRNVVDAQGFTFGAGTPLAPTDVAKYNWTILQDSNNNCYLGLNDINGAVHVKQIGRQPNTRTSNYILAFTDQDGRVEMNLAGANTLTVPLNATVPFPVGTEVKITQIGAGATTITAAGGVTGNNFGTLAQWQTVVLYKSATDTWTQTGA